LAWDLNYASQTKLGGQIMKTLLNKKTGLIAAIIVLFLAPSILNAQHYVRVKPKYHQKPAIIALSSLRLQSYHKSDMKVLLNDQIFYIENGEIAINNITPGMHKLTIIKEKRHRHPHKNFDQIIYSEYIHIPASSEVVGVIADNQLTFTDINKIRHQQHYYSKKQHPSCNVYVRY